MLQSWRHDPLFHVHQALNTDSTGSSRCRRSVTSALLASVAAVEAIPLTVERALVALDRAGGAAYRSHARTPRWCRRPTP